MENKKVLANVNFVEDIFYACFFYKKLYRFII